MTIFSAAVAEERVSPDRRNTAMTLLTVAVAAGIAGDVLLRGMPWGIAAPCWIAAIVAAVIAIVRRFTARPLTSLLFPASGAILASAGLAWRDSSALAAYDVLATLFFLLVLALPAHEIAIWRANISRWIAGMIFSVLDSIQGTFRLSFVDSRGSLTSSSRWRTGVALLRGVLIATPLLLLFGALLSSADAAFAQLLATVFDVDLGAIAGHIMLTLFLTAALAGYLRAFVWGAPVPQIPGLKPRGADVEITIALALVDVLFLTFVLVQFRYFFGGKATVHANAALTFSAYARSGFFQLVCVAALVIPLLLIADWMTEKATPGARLAFRAAAMLQVMLVASIMASAFDRMRLYQQQYGLTEQRVYTLVFIFWLASLPIWFCATVLRGQRERFAGGAVASALVALVALHVINPDVLIVRTNVQRAREGRHALDGNYVSSMSSDATDEAIAALPLLPPDEQGWIARSLLRYDAGYVKSDWRSWNLARAHSHEAVNQNRLRLQQLALKTPPPAATAPQVQAHAPAPAPTAVPAAAPTQKTAPVATQTPVSR